MKNFDIRLFLECQHLAKFSQHPVFRHGALVTNRTTIVGKGSNRSSLHAEVSALQNVQGGQHMRLRVYVCRVNARGKFMNSKPCQNCMNYMKHRGVYRVYYSDDAGGFSKLVLRNHTPVLE
ncbi:FirrV-1-A29 [Feldmannia irregularis virus a]|uniref:FirrV-1-A29 n=1 Tax=Feldmannia irregularis virus a TaxID=231992 RepID=Q6XM58_9PHYC|nr:FirrV-1-A29 [Feldmannia irregularis virus a]AAR26853.1 FirrV-1-A29 [Feldmannia irregularis virus a]